MFAVMLRASLSFSRFAGRRPSVFCSHPRFTSVAIHVHSTKYASSRPSDSVFSSHDEFVRRHNGNDKADVADMLATLNLSFLDELTDECVPDMIRRKYVRVHPRD